MIYSDADNSPGEPALCLLLFGQTAGADGRNRKLFATMDENSVITARTIGQQEPRTTGETF